jgi:hypothetical protein
MVLKRAAKLARRAPKFGHHFTEIAGQFRQLLGAKNDQGHDEDDNQVRDAKH